MRLIFVLLLAMISPLCFAGTRHPSNSDKTHIQYAAKTDYIVRLCGKDKDNRTICASAVLIKPQWIVTAAHVVKDGSNFSVVVKEKRILLDQVVYYKDFEDNVFGYHDIAVGHLAEDAGLDFYPEIYKEKGEVGKQAYICGFGLTGTFETGAVISDSHKRAGTNIIDGTDRSLLVCSIGSGVRTKYEFLIASGDSGGGLFIDNKLAGIHSCVLALDKNPNSNYGDESGHTRVSTYASWIEENTSHDTKK